MLDRDRRKRQRATCIVELGGSCGYPRLLIARQKGMRSLLFPGGRLRRKEPVVAGALRELEEETVYEAAAGDTGSGRFAPQPYASMPGFPRAFFSIDAACMTTRSG